MGALLWGSPPPICGCLCVSCLWQQMKLNGNFIAIAIVIAVSIKTTIWRQFAPEIIQKRLKTDTSKTRIKPYKVGIHCKGPTYSADKVFQSKHVFNCSRKVQIVGPVIAISFLPHLQDQKLFLRNASCNMMSWKLFWSKITAWWVFWWRKMAKP